MHALLPYQEAQKLLIVSEGRLDIQDVEGVQLSYFSTNALEVNYQPQRPTVSSYCVCLRSRLESCKQEESCYSVGVPIEKYYQTQDKNLGRLIAEDPAPVVNIYFPDNSGIADYRFDFYRNLIGFPETKTINFRSFQTSASTSLKVYFSQTATNDYPMKLNFLGITKLRIKDRDNVALSLEDMKVEQLTLVNTRLEVNSGETLTIPTLVGDFNSLGTGVAGTISITKDLYINESTASDLSGITLQKGSTLHLFKISEFPTIQIFSDHIQFSNSNERTMIVSSTTQCNFIFQDSSPLSEIPISITNEEAPTTFQPNITFLINSNMIISFSQHENNNENIQYTIMSQTISIRSIFLTMTGSYNNLNFVGFINIYLMSIETAGGFFNGVVERNVSYAMLNCTNTNLSITFKPDNIININENDIHITVDTFYIASTAQSIEMEVANGVTEFINLTFLIESDITISFDQSFESITSDTIKNIQILHLFNNLLMTTTGSVVPLVDVNDSVYNVLYEGTLTDITISPSTNFSNSNFRTGPKLNINCESGNILMPQSSILAKNSSFTLKDDTTLTILYKNSSLVSYSFENGNVIFQLEENSTVNKFESNSLILTNTNIQNTNNLPYVVKNLEFSLSSLNEQSFPSLTVKEQCFINDNTITSLTFGNYSLIVANSNTKSPIIYKEQNGVFNINTSSSSLTLYSSEEALPNNVNIYLTESNNIQLHFDKSWYRSLIPNDFIIITDATNVEVSTDLLYMPTINIVNSAGQQIQFTATEHKSDYTANLAFYIFIGIIGVLFVISLILCFCRNEEMDISSSDEDDESIIINKETDKKSEEESSSDNKQIEVVDNQKDTNVKQEEKKNNAKTTENNIKSSSDDKELNTIVENPDSSTSTDRKAKKTKPKKPKAKPKAKPKPKRVTIKPKKEKFDDEIKQSESSSSSSDDEELKTIAENSESSELNQVKPKKKPRPKKKEMKNNNNAKEKKTSSSDDEELKTIAENSESSELNQVKPKKKPRPKKKETKNSNNNAKEKKTSSSDDNELITIAETSESSDLKKKQKRNDKERTNSSSSSSDDNELITIAETSDDNESTSTGSSSTEKPLVDSEPHDKVKRTPVKKDQKKKPKKVIKKKVKKPKKQTQ
ncbi:hypothetical protein GPJ56_004807 [Histomonas meleagridis]|uniref:uncharacterized protein n=1 Tax=Histomonas meleagridis TaxID=135588 RepID=UPI00355A1F6C|nr:hypothetical protein GPJ56_004807 [Histomonas meleagridis]KAH0803458.1 hypothetical protein GO595_003802 [Histomonas meleagridis]